MSKTEGHLYTIAKAPDGHTRVTKAPGYTVRIEVEMTQTTEQPSKADQADSSRSPICSHVYGEGPLMNLAREIREINAANGWNVTEAVDWSDTYKVPAVLALITSEVSEALEAFREDDGENFVEEMADTLIRVLDLVAAFDLDFDGAVRRKMDKNRQRGHKHGGKRV